MKPVNSQELLDQLRQDVQGLIQQASELDRIPAVQLQVSPAQGQWSPAQILWHLNFYSAFYIHAITKALDRNVYTSVPVFRPGLVGDYFTKMMEPQKGEVKHKMKTVKSATPAADRDGRTELNQFLADQHRLLDLLDRSKSVNLNRVRVPSSITRLITFRLGDCFRFLIGHERRHWIQIWNAIRTTNAIAGAATGA